jgi:lysophospholipase L1-like esterase
MRSVPSLRGAKAWLLLGAALGAGLAACAPKVANLDATGSTIVCFGDSITAGVGAPAGQGYPQTLARLLDREVTVDGVPGETAADAIARIDGVLSRRPWLVIVELGGNDILHRRPLADIERDLRTIVERLQAARVVVLLVGVRPPYIGGAYEDLFAELASDYDVPVVADALADILADARLKADSVHPNAAGHQRLAEAVAARVRQLIERRKKAGFA